MSAQVELDAPTRPGDSLEARLLRRLLRSFGDPPIEFHLLWSNERVSGAVTGPLEQLRITDRRTPLGLLYDAHMRFGDAYVAGLAATLSPARATTSIGTTILAMSSMRCGLGTPWHTPAPIIRRRSPLSSRHRPRRWTTSAANCGSVQRIRWWKRDAAGAVWHCTWRPGMAQGCGPSTFPANSSNMRAGGPASRDSNTGSSSSKTITATSADPTTPSCRSGCSNTSGGSTIRNSAA
jgi:hypothetical protein